jgi:hypothetical protein
MATTTNYGFEIPDDTDLVKDGALAMRDLGQDVDTQLFTALGGDYPGLRLVKSQAIGSGVSSVICTSAFNATYANYLVVFSDTAISGASVNIALQLRTGSTTATANYYGSMIFVTYNTQAGTGIADNNGVQFSYVARSLGAAEKNTFSFEVRQPFLANKTLVASNGFIGTDIAGNYNGFHNSATSYDQFVITPASGATLTGGTIYVYGYGIS